MPNRKPLLVIVSQTIRRDLHRPFRKFAKFEVVHAYMNAAYGDMDEKDFVGVRQFTSAADLTKLLDELKPDLVQAPEPVASRAMLKASYAIWQWHRRTGKPYFFPMFENLPLRHKFGPAMGWVMGKILKRFAQDAAWIYALHEEARTTLTSLGVSGEKIIRANWGNWGIDRTEFHRAKNPAVARSKTPSVLFVGRVSTGKGVDTLLDAFDQVRKTLPTVELAIVGPKNDGGLGGHTAELLARASTMPGVTLVGPKKQRELPERFQQAWVTVLLSVTMQRWAEQVGMVNLQSLACGTPVVTTWSGSIAEYLGAVTSDAASYPAGSVFDTGNGALLVHEGDAKAATAAILSILRDPKKRETMAKAGDTWIDQTFNDAVNVPALELATYERWQALEPQP